MNFNDFLLYENVQQAKKFFKENNIDLENPNAKEKFELIKTLLKKKPNFVGLFTKFAFGEENIPISFDNGEPEKYYESLKGLLNYINIYGESLKKFLPQDIIKYDDFEELVDDIRSVEFKITANEFVKSLYPVLRNDINLNDESVVSVINDFMSLKDNEKKGMTPMKYYKENGISGKKYIEDLKDYVDSIKYDKGNVIEIINKYKNEEKLDVIFDENDVLVIRTYDKEVIKNLGAKKWCIVYAQDQYWERYCSPLEGFTQYIIFNFNLPASHKYSLIGLSLNSEGTPKTGGEQDKFNNPVRNLKEYLEEYNIPRDIFPAHTYSSEKIKKDFTEEEILNSGDAEKYYSDDDIENMMLTFDEKIKYNLKRFITEEETKDLGVDELLKYKLYDFLDDEMLQDTSVENRIFFYGEHPIDIIRRNISDEELYNLPAIFKAKKDNQYKIYLHDYLTKEDMKELDNDVIARYHLPLGGYEDIYNSFTWNQKYTWRGNEFSVKEEEYISKLSFLEKLKIKGLMDTIFDDLSDKNPEMNDEDLDYDIKIEDDNITVSDDDDDRNYDFVEDIGVVSIIDDNHDILNYLMNPSYHEIEVDLYGNEESYWFFLSSELQEKFKELITAFGLSTHNIEEEGKFVEFLNKYKDLLEVDVEDIESEISSQTMEEFEAACEKVLETLPYEIVNRSELKLPQSYLIELAEKNPDASNIGELLEHIDSIGDVVDRYNNDPENNEHKLEDVPKIDDFINNCVINDKAILNSIQESLNNVDEDIETKIANVKYCNEIISKLGFDDKNILINYKTNKRIKIIETNFSEKKVKIEIDVLDGVDEEGWVQVDNLSNYIEKNLFESKIITKFNKFKK